MPYAPYAPSFLSLLIPIMHQRSTPHATHPPTRKFHKLQNAPTHFASDAMRNEY
jgi:hypothetical protein